VLGRLWASGEVADDLLPRLIKAMEPRLRRRDFLRPATKGGLWLLAWLSGSAAAACVAAILALASGVWSDQASSAALIWLLRWLAGLLSIPVAALFILDTVRKARDRRIEAGFRDAMANRCHNVRW
jgi:hypothetical protein